MPASDIVVKGAREHNLRDVDLVLPRNKLICLTGVSGSGKSSLAFDTLYAEGQRRYVESLSSFARQFLGQMPKPDVDYIGGLSPSISISQKSTGSNPRSTVGTITEIYDYLRVLFARVGQGHCPQCGRPITAQTREQILARILQLPEGTRFSVLAPLIRGQKGEYRDLFEDLLKQGFVRARVDGDVVSLTRRPAAGPPDAAQHRGGRRPAGGQADDPAAAGRGRRAGAEARQREPDRGGGVEDEPTADAGGARAAEARRATRSEKSAARRTTRSQATASGSQLSTPDSRLPDDIIFSAAYACRDCGLSFEPPSPQLFSFNSPQGMCLECDGLGERFSFDPELLDPRSEPLAVVQAGLLRTGRVVDGPGPLAAAHLSGRGRHAGAQAAAWPPARCWRRPGRNSIRSCRTSGCGAPATSTSRSPGAAAPRRSSTAASSRASSPSCCRSTATPRTACTCGSWKST